MTEKGSCLQHFLCAHASGNDGDAITLLSEAWRAHRNEIAGALSDDQFRFAVGTFKVMNEADCLAFAPSSRVISKMPDSGASK